MGSVPKLSEIGVAVRPDEARALRDKVATLLKSNKQTFPGAQPVSFGRHHLKELEERDYFLCEKTDGIRCMLYCTTDKNEREIQYLIDRRNDYYYLPHSLHLPPPDDKTYASFHQNTLMDGELVHDHEPDGVKLRYLAFDLLAIDKERLMEKRFDKRIGRLRNHIVEPYKGLCRKFPDDVKIFPFELRVKDMQKSYGIEMLFRDILPRLAHGNDGLIFQCIETSYTMGTDESIVKWKPPHENTIDFLLHLGDFPTFDPEDGLGPTDDFDAKPSFSLCVHHGRQEYEHFADLYLTDEEWDAMKRVGEVLDLRILECYRDDLGRWRAKMDGLGVEMRPRFRDDKQEPNHVSTVLKVLESIGDAVTQEDLFKHAFAVKTAWKRRDERRAREKQAAEEEEAAKRRDERRAAEEEAAKRIKQSQ